MFEAKNVIHDNSDPTAHAEMKAIRDFCQLHNVTDLSEYTLYSSCEPCCMCSGAAVWSKLGNLVYSASHDQLQEIAGFNIMIGSQEVFEKSPFSPIVKSKVLNAEGTALLKKHFQ